MRRKRSGRSFFRRGKGVEDMAVVYATLIIKGRKTLEQVPAILREQVEQILEDLEVKL